MNRRAFTQSIDRIGNTASPQQLAAQLQTLFEFVANNDTLSDTQLVHQSLNICSENILLDYLFKRLVLGTAVDLPKIQRNYLHALLVAISTFSASLSLEALIAYVEANLGNKSALNRAEARCFAFAFLQISFAVVDIFEAEEANAESLGKLLERCVEIVAKEPFARLFASGIIESREEPSDLVVRFIELVAPKLNFSNYQDVDFALTARSALSVFKPTKQTKLISDQLGKVLKDLNDTKGLLKLFDSVNKDETLKDEEISLKLYEKLGKYFVANLDTRIGTILSLSKHIDANRLTKNQGASFTSNLFHLLLTFGEIVANCQNLDGLINYFVSKGQMDDLQQGLVLMLSQRSSKTPKVLQAFQKFEKTLIAALSSAETPSKRFQESLLQLFYSSEILQKTPSSLRELLLRRPENAATVLTLADRFRNKVSESVQSGDIQDFKQSIARLSSLMPHISLEASLQESLDLLFNSYKNMPQIAPNFGEALKENSPERLTTVLRDFVFQRIFQAAFKQNTSSMLPTLAKKWLKINKKKDEFDSLTLSKSLETKEAGRFLPLSKLNMVLLFQNYASEDPDVESLVFGQSLEDLTLFSQKVLASGGNIEQEDCEIFIDVLISLLNKPSTEIRKLVADNFSIFADLYEENCFDLVESAIFKNLHEKVDDEEDEDEMSQNGGTDDEEDEDDDENDIVLEGALF